MSQQVTDGYKQILKKEKRFSKAWWIGLGQVDDEVAHLLCAPSEVSLLCERLQGAGGLFK